MKPLTYIKIQGGEMLATDKVKPEEPNWGQAGVEIIVEYYAGKETFNDSFVKVGNPEILEDHLRLHFGKGDGLYPVSGLQFEVKTVDAPEIGWSVVKKVAIVSLIESKSEPSVSKEKEELLKRFVELYRNNGIKNTIASYDRDTIFDFFYSEIEQRASRIKALEEELAFEIRVANAQTEINKELAQEKAALEERLEAAYKLIECVPLNNAPNGYSRNIYLPGFNEALKKYNKLKA